jgi:hypothetical protein
MTTTPATTPAADDSFDGEGLDDAGFETMRADAVWTGRVMSSGEYISGLLTAGLLKAVVTPQALLKDRWPGLDPAVVQQIFDLGCASGWAGSQMYARPSLHGDDLAAFQAQLSEAAFHAMGGSVLRSRRLVAPEVPHPADGERPQGH